MNQPAESPSWPVPPPSGETQGIVAAHQPAPGAVHTGSLPGPSSVDEALEGTEFAPPAEGQAERDREERLRLEWQRDAVAVGRLYATVVSLLVCIVDGAPAAHRVRFAVEALEATPGLDPSDAERELLARARLWGERWA